MVRHTRGRIAFRLGKSVLRDLSTRATGLPSRDFGRPFRSWKAGLIVLFVPVRRKSGASLDRISAIRDCWLRRLRGLRNQSNCLPLDWLRGLNFRAAQFLHAIRSLRCRDLCREPIG